MASVNQQDEENLSAEVDHLLEEGLSQKDIEARGYSPSLVRQRIRKRLKAGKGASGSSGRSGSLAVRKERELVLPEWVAAQLDLFDGSERDKRIFMSGLTIPLLGLRLFCEAMEPFTRLLGTWQKGQSAAAAEAQGSSIQIAHEAAASAVEAIAPALDSLKTAITASSPNPMLSVLASVTEPFLKQAMGQLLGAFMPGKANQTGTESPGSTITKEEMEKVFHDGL
jgi:hypothetical protein